MERSASDKKSLPSPQEIVVAVNCFAYGKVTGYGVRKSSISPKYILKYLSVCILTTSL